MRLYLIKIKLLVLKYDLGRLRNLESIGILNKNRYTIYFYLIFTN
jgi:hypothetical protein